MAIKDAFASIDLAELKSWIGVKQEDLQLDCKLLSGGSDLDATDKKNLGKAISGFANSDGGIIAWGVDARKDPQTGVDVVSALAPIPDVQLALGRLQSLTGEATSPIAEGVVHKIVPDAGTSGYIITLVPASDAAPHMTRLGGSRTYYKRSGDSFYPMEHFDIADMFGRRARARLGVALLPRSQGGSSSPGLKGRTYLSKIYCTVTLENTGRALARFPFLQLRAGSPFKLSDFGLDGNGAIGLPKRPGGRMPSGATDWSIFAGGSNDVIHPGTSLAVTEMVAEFPEADEYPEIQLEYTVGADGIAVQEGKVTISAAVLKDLVLGYISREKGRG